MTRIAKTAGLCLASMLMMGMALAGTASATELLWLVCLKGKGLTKYSGPKCQELAPVEGEWQSLGLLPGQSITVRLLAQTILLRDTGAKSAVLCFNTGSRGLGLIEEGSKGKVLVAEYENAKANCRGAEGCEKEGVEEVKGIDLPWKTTVGRGTNGEPLAKLESDGNGEPGWEVVCKVAGVKKADKCTTEAGHPEEVELVNEVTKNPGGELELLVRSRFQQVGEGKCTLGGAKAAKVLGLLAILLPGGALSIITSP